MVSNKQVDGGIIITDLKVDSMRPQKKGRNGIVAIRTS